MDLYSLHIFFKKIERIALQEECNSLFFYTSDEKVTNNMKSE